MTFDGQHLDEIRAYWSISADAEGVETTDERDCLIALGCDLLQGYLLGRPSPDLP